MSLSEFPGVKTPPEYESEFLRFMNPLLDALREKGGQARPREIYDAIAQRLNLSEEQRTGCPYEPIWALIETVPLSSPIVTVTVTGFVVPVRLAFCAAAAKA